MSPPPFIPSLDEETYDKDVVAGLEGLHKEASSELFQPTPPRSRVSTPDPPTQPRLVGQTQNGLPARNPGSFLHSPYPSSWPPVDPPFSIAAPSPSPARSSHSLHQQRSQRPSSHQITTVYYSTGPHYGPHDSSSLISISTDDRDTLLAYPNSVQSRSFTTSRSASIPVPSSSRAPSSTGRIASSRQSMSRNTDIDERDQQDDLPAPSAMTSPTGVASGGAALPPSEYASLAATPSASYIRRPILGTYSRVPAGPVGQPGPPTQYQSAQASVHHHSQSLPPSSYYPPLSSQEYTRATPSPVYMGQTYGMQYSTHQISTHLAQHASTHRPPGYGNHGTASYTIGSSQAPGLPHMVSAPPGFQPFTQPFGHPGMITVNPDLGAHMGYGAMYQQYLSPQDLTPPGLGINAASGTNDGLLSGGSSSGYSRSPNDRSATVGGSAMSSPSGPVPRSSRASVQAPAMVQHPYQSRLSPHSHPQTSPVAHSPPIQAFPQYSNPAPHMAPYPYPSPSFRGYSQPASPLQPPFGPYQSPPLGPGMPSMEDPHARPPVLPFQSTQGGTWWYVPAGGGPPQQFPGQGAAFEYQGPFTMGFPAPAPSSPSPRQPSFKGPPSRPPRYQNSSRRGTHTRGGNGGSGRPRGQPSGPHGGGPTGAGLAAGSPSGGSGSHHTSSGSADNPALSPELRRSLYTSGFSTLRKGKSPVRQAFHPKPPSHGYEWVMWVGNIPEDATQNEVWNFFKNSQAISRLKELPHWRGQSFTRVASAASAGEGSATPTTEVPVVGEGGVASVFLIRSSNCAFVNFDTEDALKRAMRVFNGVPLRPYDPSCQPLVCRIRRKDDDLRTGVAAQRGWGLHTNWIRMQAEAMKKAGLVPAEPSLLERRRKNKGKAREQGESAKEGEDASKQPSAEGETDLESPPILVPSHLRSHDDPPTSPSTHLGPSSSSDPSPPIVARLERLGSLGTGRRPDPTPQQSSSASSASYTSTNSSFLAKHFPKRYFILKSISEYDLKLSVQRGLWATQPHNEPVLDQAFRTSKEVYLIFGVNRSGEFFGYARMIGGITKSERPIHWAPRQDSVLASSQPTGSLGAPRQHTSSYSAIAEDPDAEGQTDRPALVVSESASAVPMFDAPSQFATSPQPITPGEGAEMPSLAVQHPRPRAQAKEIKSAPPELGPPYKRVSRPDPAPTGETVDLPMRVSGLTLAAPQESARDGKVGASMPLVEDKVVTEEDLRRRAEDPGSSLHQAILQQTSSSHPNLSSSGHPQPSSEAWGTPFKVQWIRTDRLPFARTRHLRNRWNHDREVKISRDGIELEPTTGEALLAEWAKQEDDKAAFHRLLATGSVSGTPTTDVAVSETRPDD
ncbi:hypothetical protein FRB99_000271 [Tulasnella sp. 403]|nr:hypothetical protein FRB99_000271 [Tulasnella sp. 403]